MTQQEIDEKFMRLAINEARNAFDQKEVPIGAVVVSGDAVVGRGHNLVETLGDPTAHAEMQALTAATETLGSKYLPQCTLYVTVEPCIMCAGAIGWAQVGRVVWGGHAGHRQIHADLRALALEVGAQAVQNFLGHALRHADHMLGGPAHLTALLDKLLSRNLALGALLRGLFAFPHITANAANPLHMASTSVLNFCWLSPDVIIHGFRIY